MSLCSQLGGCFSLEWYSSLPGKLVINRPISRSRSHSHLPEVTEFFCRCCSNCGRMPLFAMQLTYPLIFLARVSSSLLQRDSHASLRLSILHRAAPFGARSSHSASSW